MGRLCPDDDKVLVAWREKSGAVFFGATDLPVARHPRKPLSRQPIMTKSRDTRSRRGYKRYTRSTV